MSEIDKVVAAAESFTVATALRGSFEVFKRDLMTARLQSAKTGFEVSSDLGRLEFYESYGNIYCIFSFQGQRKFLQPCYDQPGASDFFWKVVDVLTA